MPSSTSYKEVENKAPLYGLLMWDEFIDIIGQHPILNPCIDTVRATNNCMK